MTCRHHEIFLRLRQEALGLGLEPSMATEQARNEVNRMIRRAVLGGATRKTVGQFMGLSRERIRQIVFHLDFSAGTRNPRSIVKRSPLEKWTNPR